MVGSYRRFGEQQYDLYAGPGLYGSLSKDATILEQLAMLPGLKDLLLGLNSSFSRQTQKGVFNKLQVVIVTRPVL